MQVDLRVDVSSCGPSRIERFFQRDLNDQEQSRFEQHLEQCETCRIELDQQTAALEQWSQASEFLRDEPFELTPLSSSESASPLTPSVRLMVERLAPTDDPRMLGRIGPYEIAGVIGSGGMGTVLKGFDAALNRYVAIKMLAPHLADSGAAKQRFAREAQAAAAVVHENVIEIYGVAEAEGSPYLVMKYVRGASLQKRLEQHGPLSVSKTLRVGMQTAAGLAAAHAQGLVHRDVKPGNILLAEGVERVKLTDFGLARAADDASLTHSGVLPGTPQYMSPEQAEGKSLDHRSDLFSLGSVMYAMLAGRPPFRAETSYGVLRKICESEPRPLRELNPAVPLWLEEFLQKLLAKSPGQRFQSAAEVELLLAESLAHLQHPSKTPLPPSLRPAKKSPAASRLWLSIGLILAVGWLGWTFSGAGRGGAEQGGAGRGGPSQTSASENSEETPPAADTLTDDFFWNDGVDQELLRLKRETERLKQEAWPRDSADFP